MAREKKYNFLPSHQIGNEPAAAYEYTVRVTKQGTLAFNKFDIDMYELSTKFFKFYLDRANKVLGWRVAGDYIPPEELKRGKNQVYKKLTVNSSGAGLISIQSDLKKLDIDPLALTERKFAVHKLKGELLENGPELFIDLSNR